MNLLSAQPVSSGGTTSTTVCSGSAASTWLSSGRATVPHARPLMSFFTGVHILLPILDRVRFEIGAGQDLSYPEETFWAFTIGIFDKAMLQRERLR